MPNTVILCSPPVVKLPRARKLRRDPPPAPQPQESRTQMFATSAGVTNTTGPNMSIQAMSFSPNLVLGAGWSSKGATGTATKDSNDLVVAGIGRCDP
ncbi:hypothetical protein F5877DRAFT_86836 [Lentinula edodes]|nr:hypothetical protein F5877DRAFT_86836 [Lentinula edodes]